MSQLGPIVIVEDDHDDQELIQSAYLEIGVLNEVVFFDKCVDAYNYLKTSSEQPFIILSDMNLPLMTGIEFKRKIDEDPQLRQKAIPFLFFSTAVEKHNIESAYRELTVQGFFKKNNLFEGLVQQLKVIFDYWQICYHPNN